MPEIKRRPLVPTQMVDEKEHRRVIAEQANAGIPVLRDWTPVLTFGGATTGITYSSQVGRAVTYSGVVHEAWVDLVLTSKGSATGSATITGLLEYNRSGVDVCSGSLAIHNASGTQRDLKAELVNGAIIIDLYHSHGASTGTGTLLNDTDFTNTSEIHLHISYRIV